MTHMSGEQYDIIIAGGGPSGLSAARTASEKGLEVLVLELQAQIGGQTQTSAWVSSQILDDDLEKAKKSEIKKVRIHSTKKELEIEGGFGVIVDRKILDKLLASKAVKEGTDIWVGSPVRNLLKGRGGVKGVKSEAGEWSEEIEGKIVIDATGAKSEWSSLFLREILDSDWNREKTNQANEYLMSNVESGKEVDIYFNSVLAPSGHAWIYPDEHGFAMAGIRGTRIHPDSALDEFIGQKEPKRLKNSVPIGAYRGKLPIEGSLEKTVSDGALAVGESAGQIYPLSGRGLRYALESGETAGKIAAEAVEEGDTSKEKLSEYEDIWRNSFEREIETGEILQDSLETSPDRKMNTLLEKLDENPELKKSFMDIFLGENLEKSIKEFFKNEDCRQIFGEKNVRKLISLYP